MRASNRLKLQPIYKTPNQRGLLPTRAHAIPKSYLAQGNNTQIKLKTLIAAERDEKLAKGLCFFCDQPYERGHKCNIKKTQLFLIEIPEIEEDEVDSDRVEEEGKELVEEEIPHISINALSGLQGYQTMRVTEMHGKVPLHILLDSGSTHNFLDLSAANKLGCTIEQTPVQSVIVADGNQLQCLDICRGFK